ncbi:TPA: long-chain fatty acid--CoA ligase [Pseudomonas aeruginosa]|nr:long-chain fatty acid--CoA ligase [Pseudomonas aeruginosa]HEJ3069983.1 long-chain fatty acid--CoA ligase [Pseudomonas aeruginosa]
MLGQMMRNQLVIGSLVEHAARYHGAREVVSVETSGEVTRSCWKEVELRARKLASALGKMGLTPSDRCATIAWNNIRHLEVYYAVSGAGMVCHTINPRLFIEQITYVINHAEDKVVFLDDTFLPIIAEIRGSLPKVKAFVLMAHNNSNASVQMPGLIAYEDLIGQGDDNYIWPDVDENEASSLCYTSGTTGNPKGVLYSHRSTVLHSMTTAMPDTLNLSARDTILPVVPMFHVNAWGTPYSAAMVGAKLVLPGPALDGASLSKLIASEGVSIALGVPVVWQGLLAAQAGNGSKSQSLTRVVVGGSACPASMIREFNDIYGVEVIHAWGMTELSPFGTANTPLAHHVDLSPDEKLSLRKSQGRPPYGVELKIVNDEGIRLPEDGRSKGNLMARGHWVIKDYFHSDPGSTLSDGWFSTGDVATIDSDGFMTICDRAKDIIKSGGEWISTVELESIAIAHPHIVDAAVIAARHEKWDERPLLIAVKSPNSELTSGEVCNYFADKVARWQIPDAAIFVEELPRNGTGKILKNRLREKYGDILLRSSSSVCE